jgi:hypothetical protein
MSTDPLISLFYSLLRDHIQPSDLEALVREACDARGALTHFTNGWLADYAEDLALRLRQAHRGSVEKASKEDVVAEATSPLPSR